MARAELARVDQHRPTPTVRGSSGVGGQERVAPGELGSGHAADSIATARVGTGPGRDAGGGDPWPRIEGEAEGEAVRKQEGPAVLTAGPS